MPSGDVTGPALVLGRIRWRITEGPWFANMLAELYYDGRRARIRFDRTVPAASGTPASGTPDLAPACEAELTPKPASGR